MPLEIKTVTRVFAYNGRTYPDPAPTASPEEVMQILAASGLPEISNGAVVGPKFEDGKETYTIKALTQHKG